MKESNFKAQSALAVCTFRLNNQRIMFRVAKTTPKKAGQFVTLWKRAESGLIAPYDLKDEIDLFVVVVYTPKHVGQFIFSKEVLFKKGVISGNGQDGKRAIRVYPSWDTTTSRKAKSTQTWQLKYFLEITQSEEEFFFNTQKRYKMKENPKPNLQLIYVSDIKRSTDFYKMLFNTEPVFSSPRYVAFSAGSESLFAIWTGGVTSDTAVTRFSEVGIMVPSNDDVERLYEGWKENPNIKIVQEPQTEVFGRTFLVKDPDGHIIRVCPLNRI